MYFRVTKNLDSSHSILVSIRVLQLAYPGFSKLGYGLIQVSENRMMLTCATYNWDTRAHVNTLNNDTFDEKVCWIYMILVAHIKLIHIESI